MTENNQIKKETQKEIENKINKEKTITKITDNVKKNNKITKQDIIDFLKDIKLTELNELVKAIEEYFGVTASAPAMMQQTVSRDNDNDSAAPTEVKVILTKLGVGGSKFAVIKVVAEIIGKPLMEAKKLVEGVNPVIKEKIKPEEAEEIKEKLVAAGAVVEIK